MDVQERSGRQRPGRPTDQKLTCETLEHRVLRAKTKAIFNKTGDTNIINNSEVVGCVQ